MRVSVWNILVFRQYRFNGRRSVTYREGRKIIFRRIHDKVDWRKFDKRHTERTIRKTDTTPCPRRSHRNISGRSCVIGYRRRLSPLLFHFRHHLLSIRKTLPFPPHRATDRGHRRRRRLRYYSPYTAAREHFDDTLDVLVGGGVFIAYYYYHNYYSFIYIHYSRHVYCYWFSKITTEKKKTIKKHYTLGTHYHWFDHLRRNSCFRVLSRSPEWYSVSTIMRLRFIVRCRT